MPKDMSDAELDRMIDDSIKKQKEEGKAKESPKREEEPKKEGGQKAGALKAGTKKSEGPKEKPKKEGKPGEEGKEAKTEKKEAKPAEKTAPEIKGKEGYNPWDILVYPHLTEKSMNMVELENKLVFIVRRKAKKPEIKEAVEKGFNVKVLSVETEITRKGQKKAYVKLAPESSATDIATRLGMI